MKKLSVITILCFLFYLTEAANIGKNGAVRRCYKKVIKSESTENNSDNSDNNNNPKISCKSLVTDIPVDNADVNPVEENDSNNNNDDNIENSDDDNVIKPNSKIVTMNYRDSLIIPQGTLLDNQECTTAIYDINKLLKEIKDNLAYEQSCDTELDLEGFNAGLNELRTKISGSIEDAVNKCGDSKVWKGAELHKACRVLSKTGQTVCRSIVDNVYEKYDPKCLQNASFKDMWEFSKWLWEGMLTINDSCYLRQLYDYKCSPTKDALVHMGPNHYSLRLLCESANNSCDWPGKYDGDNAVIKCLSNNIIKNKNKALDILKKNGYVCEGTTDLPQNMIVDEENETVSVNNDSEKIFNAKTTDKKNPVSSGTEPYTNTNQIIGTIFIALFALLF